MLFYESSKCFHGRPKKLNGSWYSSLFVHYMPTYGWSEIDHDTEGLYAIPPHWREKVALLPPVEEVPERLELVGTSMKEPDCLNNWCATVDPVKWSGPGEAGKWIDPTFKRHPFDPKPVIWNETQIAAAIAAWAWAQPVSAAMASSEDLTSTSNNDGALEEPGRLAEYHKRNYTWPLSSYSPNTSGWKALMERRLRQVEQLPYADRRYEGFYRTIHAAAIVPNFTEHGFGLARCPDELLGALQQGVREGLASGELQPIDDFSSGPIQPLLVSRPDLTNRALSELHHYAETWAQIPLTAYLAYGFPLFQNETQQFMHIEEMQTNIISFILHIDSSEDAGTFNVIYKRQCHSLKPTNPSCRLFALPTYFVFRTMAVFY
jgi:hypothetical protein